ncbi:hypothetical protein Hte_002161 [Hypoxylon texense]
MQQPTRFAALAAFLLCQTRLAFSFDAPHIWPVEPWKINSLRITVPAGGYRGNGSHTNMSIALAIENPNTVTAGPKPGGSGGGYLSFEPSAATCYTEAPAPGAGGVIKFTSTSCTETTEFSYGAFTVGGTVPDPRRAFDLAFSLEYNVTRWGGVLSKTYDAAARFEVGRNLAEGVYDNVTHTYSYSLRTNSTPAYAQPVMSECQGYCQLPPTNASTATNVP